MKLIKKTMIFLAVLIVGLLAVSSVSATDMVNESSDLLNYENNNEISEVIDDSVISMELEKNMSDDTELDKIGNCLDAEISIVDRNVENETETTLQANDAKIVANSVNINRPITINYYFKVLDSNNNPIPDTYFSYHYLSHSGAAYTDSNGKGYINIDIPWETSPGNYPIVISSNGISVTTYIKFSSNEVNYIDYNNVAIYKKTNYFKVEINGFYDYKPVKNLKLALKIYTGKKYKTYYITTNNNGIAKFDTKNLKIGSHKYIVTSTNKKYKIKEYGTITIKKATKKTIKKTTTTKKTTTKKKSNTVSVKNGKYGNKNVITVKVKDGKKTIKVKCVYKSSYKQYLGSTYKYGKKYCVSIFYEKRNGMQHGKKGWWTSGGYGGMSDYSKHDYKYNKYHPVTSLKL